MRNKDEAIKLLTAFYETIERTIEDPTTTSKTWRRLWMGKDKEMETVFYAQDALNAAVDSLLQNKIVDDNYTHKALSNLVADRLGIVCITFSEVFAEKIEELVDELVTMVSQFSKGQE